MKVVRVIVAAATAVTVLVAAVGCRTPATRLSVEVDNRSEGDVAVWLAKRGGPVEADWLSPGQWAFLYEADSDTARNPPTVTIPPGGSARLGPVTGRFEGDAYPVLHVFSAPVTPTEMAATARRSRLRDDVRLSPGRNVVQVRSHSPVEARRVDPTRPAD